MLKLGIVVAGVLLVALFGALFLPSASADSNNNPGENNTNNPGNEPKDGNGGGGNPGNNNPGENNMNNPGNEPKDP